MNSLHSSFITAATIAAAIGVIGAVSITVYQKFIEQRNSMSNNNLDALNLKVSELQAELAALRAQQNEQKRKRKNRKHASKDNTYTSTNNDTDIDTFSTADTDAATDIGDDEFFDCSDSEPDNEIRTAEPMSQMDLVLAEIDRRTESEEGFEEEVYFKLRDLKDSHPEDPNVIWRFARACYDLSVKNPDTTKEVIVEGINACKKILEQSPHQNGDFHTWYAVLIGCKIQHASTSDKIKDGYLYRDQVVTALEKHPHNPLLHHLLGRFRYEVANLSWLERKLATTLFSEPPQATLEEALECFEKAEELYSKPEIRNRLFLAKVHIGLNNYQKVAYWLSKTCELDAMSKEDREMIGEAKKLISKYSSYI